jgi:alkanesulfonate monooxygenase SsuD/methylene tetrahydromethanopterin reductase-like flavin-dependent oxidoreductase (luciferase family)
MTNGPGGGVQVGICHMPRDPAAALELALVAEAAGVSVFGVADSQHLFGAVYPLVQHVLAGTTRLRAGPLVTNPVTQHPSVHAASLAALAALYPGRVMAALGSGDSAVRSVGLRPASRQQLAADISYIAGRLGGTVPVWAAASGPRAAAATPPAATAVLLGGGLDAAWLSRLAGLAEASAGHRLERWAFLVGALVADPAQAAAARAAVAVPVLGVSRHGMTADPERAGAPAKLVPGLRALYAQADVRGHGQPDGVNRGVLDRFPAQARYLFERFAVVGTPAEAARRLRPVAEQAGLTGFILSSTVPDPAAHIRLAGRELAPLLG